MVEPVGKKLSQARQERGLSIDEAAHATRLRPDKIAALESDDYSRFANSIYAKGFLQIYARFLDVDVSEFARTLDNTNPISVSDYQYLSNAPAPRPESLPARREERRAPSLAPLFFFVVLVALGLAGSWFYANYQRIVGEPAAREKTGQAAATPVPNADAEFVTGAPPAAPTPIRITAAAVPAPLPAGSAAKHPSATPAPLAVAPPPPHRPDQDFVSPTPVAAGDPTARPLPPGGMNEVLVATVKKTWVTVRRDDPKAPPIFEDYVYPNSRPLKLKGARFFIEAREPASVQITKNGLPYAYQPAGVPVQ
jgi:cytoskeleton protein RodZ